MKRRDFLAQAAVGAASVVGLTAQAEHRRRLRAHGREAQATRDEEAAADAGADLRRWHPRSSPAFR